MNPWQAVAWLVNAYVPCCATAAACSVAGGVGDAPDYHAYVAMRTHVV
jgi:hypothetical protein